jgi:carotenoid cleavage dioxygenase-like enzyme
MEERSVDELRISGDIPEWISGSLYRNGPGRVNLDKPMNHWFDGLAMLHKYRIEKGKVSYLSRFVDCGAYRSFRETGKMMYSDFATDPCRSLFGKFMTAFSRDPISTDSAKVNLGKIGDSHFAFGEPLMQIEFDPETLRTIGNFDYGIRSSAAMTTAHPHRDGEESYNLVVHYGPVNYYTIYSVDKDRNTRKVASIPVLHPSYLHSFGMSPRYFIIAEFPFVVQSVKLVARMRPFIENFLWKPRNNTKFYVIDRINGKLKSIIKVPPFFAFHHINAFELGEDLVVDLAAYKDATVISDFYINRLSRSDYEVSPGTLQRFVLDLRNSSLKEHRELSGETIELPVFDAETYSGRGDYRYVYGCGVNKDRRKEFYNQVLKIDLQTGKSLFWHQPGYFPGEPVFVPHPERKSEDHGVLLSVVLDSAAKRSFLLFLDAASLREIARADLPHSVLFGYHGTFYSEKD